MYPWENIEPKLGKDGLYIVGIDVIGCITYINRVHKNKYKFEEKVIDFLESKVLNNLEAFNRRSRLRKIFEEA